MAGEIEKLLELIVNGNDEVKIKALEAVLNLTGSDDGIKLIIESKGNTLVLENLKQHIINDPKEKIEELVLKIFINVSAEEKGSCQLCSQEYDDKDIITYLISVICEEGSVNADLACQVLANITRNPNLCPLVLEKIKNTSAGLLHFVYILCYIGYNKKGATLDYLAPVICNLTQFKEGRRHFLNKEKCIFERLLPFTDYQKSKIRRRACIAAIHNCCFEKEFHEWMLSDDVDLAPRLALPLAGPNTLTDEENDSLPFDLQFLPEDKIREEDPELRALILESFMQLCTKRKCREILRNQNIYLILREHHKWEIDKKCLRLNEDVVNILIKTEEEIGEEDLSNIQVPEDLIQKFNNFDVQTLE